MDHRIGIAKGSILDFKSERYEILSEIGRGSSCIVYNAKYRTNINDEKTIIIKEFYPYKLSVKRNKEVLIPDDSEEFGFEMDRFINSFKRCNELFNHLHNKVTNTINIYELNGTRYIVAAFVHGNILSFEEKRTLRDCCTLIKNVSKIISEIHKQGYLYLDLKPSNVFVLENMDHNVQFFDFDSLYPINHQERDGYEISYSSGFAPYELVSGDIDNIGVSTDVYELGAILFYLLFGRTPNVLDCETDEEVDFTGSIIKPEKYNNKTIKLLNDFFHNSLSFCSMDRFQNVQSIIDLLNELIPLSSPEGKYIVSSKISSAPIFIGREKEMHLMKEAVNNMAGDCLFVSGMRGIGKSTLVKEYIRNNYSLFDNVLFLRFNGSIIDTINDDYSLQINGLAKYDGKSDEEYYKEKIKILSDLSKKEKTIIIIDDFNSEIDKNTLALINSEFKTIFITDRTVDNKYKNIQINQFSDIDDQILLFKKICKVSLDSEETEQIKEICNMVNGHTMMIECLAKQLLNSHVSVNELYKTVKENSVLTGFSEKITLELDNIEINKSVTDIFLELFNINGYKEKDRSILKILTLFNGYDIGIREFENYYNSPCIDEINELIRRGYIEFDLDTHTLSLHPIIYNLFTVLDWSGDELREAIRIVKTLYLIIHINSYKVQVPKPVKNSYIKLRREYDSNIRARETILKNVEKNDSITENISLARILSDPSADSCDRSVLNRFIRASEYVLKNGRLNKQLSDNEYYRSLDYDVLYNQPRYNENYILNNYSRFVDCQILNHKLKIELIDYIAFIYLERKDFENANRMIERSEVMFGKNPDNYIKAKIYEMKARVYDYSDLSDADNYRKLVYYSDECIRYAKKRSKYRYSNELLLVKELAGKCIVMARTENCNKTKFFKTIRFAEKLANKYCQDISEGWMAINNAYAYYYSFVESDLDKAMEYKLNASKISGIISSCHLDYIDDSLIPLANMLLILKEYDLSEKYLKKGIELCNKYNDFAPYLRKKQDLESYLNDVAEIRNE